jgi:hypothetical protein
MIEKAKQLEKEMLKLGMDLGSPLKLTTDFDGSGKIKFKTKEEN